MYVTSPEISTPILEKVCIHMNIYTYVYMYVYKCKYIYIYNVC